MKNHQKFQIMVAVLGVLVLSLACAIPSPQPAPTATAAPVEVTVYFTDEAAYAAGIPPFEVGVLRVIDHPANLPAQVLEKFFEGPTADELAAGLVLISSGFTGLKELVVMDNVAHVYLEGECFSNGATYTVAGPILRNLEPFGFDAVKIYDQDGVTELPEGKSNSIPWCLEP